MPSCPPGVSKSDPNYQGHSPAIEMLKGGKLFQGKRSHLGAVLQQQLHDVVVGLVGGDVERGEELLVLVIQVATLPERFSMLKGVTTTTTTTTPTTKTSQPTNLQRVSATDFLLGKGELTAQCKAESPV